MTLPHLRGGQAANATVNTMIRHHWIEAVELAVIAEVGVTTTKLGGTGQWLRENQRPRIVRAYLTGETVWMAADAMIQLMRGAMLATKGPR